MASHKIYAGASLRETRNRHGLTQRVFADRLGVSLPYLSQMENNHRPVSAGVLLRLASEFSVDVGALAAGDADRMVVVGFSQGTMMALHILPRRDRAVAGIVGFSGRLLAPELLAEVKVRPPVLLVHGDQDQMVPFADMGLAERALSGAGFTVGTHAMRGTGHGISPDGLGAALAFVRDVLG